MTQYTNVGEVMLHLSENVHSFIEIILETSNSFIYI